MKHLSHFTQCEVRESSSSKSDVKSECQEKRQLEVNANLESQDKDEVKDECYRRD